MQTRGGRAARSTAARGALAALSCASPPPAVPELHPLLINQWPLSRPWLWAVSCCSPQTQPLLAAVEAACMTRGLRPASQATTWACALHLRWARSCEAAPFARGTDARQGDGAGLRWVADTAGAGELLGEGNATHWNLVSEPEIIIIFALFHLSIHTFNIYLPVRSIVSYTFHYHYVRCHRKTSGATQSSVVTASVSR